LCPSAPLNGERYTLRDDSRLGRARIVARRLPSEDFQKPNLVAQVAFTEWTDGGSLRHARFIDQRTDKRAADVVREG